MYTFSIFYIYYGMEDKSLRILKSLMSKRWSYKGDKLFSSENSKKNPV